MCALKRPGHAVVLRTDASPEKGGLNSGNYNDPKVGKLIETARHTSDPAARIKLYEKIDRILHDDAPWIFVASGKQNAVMKSLHCFVSSTDCSWIWETATG